MIAHQEKEIPPLRFIAMSTDEATAYRGGFRDANGNIPERMPSDGSGCPCRHCLRDIAAGKGMLLLAWCPFSRRHAYAETGPVFLCEDACSQYAGNGTLPEVVSVRPRFMLRAYDDEERIVDGSGSMTQTPDIIARAAELLNDKRVQSVHVRSGTNTCFICRIER